MTEILALKSLAIVKKSFDIPDIPRVDRIPESRWEIAELFPLKPRKRSKGLAIFNGYSWKKVEYDMDDQGIYTTKRLDRHWLEMYNSKYSCQLTPDSLELIMDRIEKEWFLLVILLSKYKDTGGTNNQGRNSLSRRYFLRRV